MAHSKFKEMISAQGGDPEITPERFRSKLPTLDIRAPKEGQLVDYDNRTIKKIARLAGAPVNPGAGLDLYKKTGDMISRGELLLNIHCGSEEKQSAVYDFLSRNRLFTIE